MEQAIRNYLTPSTFAREPAAIETANGLVLAVNVPPSFHLVALWHKELKAGIEYLYRTDHGKQWMNPDEVEKHLMNGSRAARLAVQEAAERIKQARPNVQFHPAIELVPSMIRLVHGTSRRTPPQIAVPAIDVQPVLTACGDLSLSLASGGSPNLAVEIPYELVKASWVTGDGRLGLCLDVRLCVHSDRISLNPLEQWLDVLRG
jgi:hypothetical protein